MVADTEPTDPDAATSLPASFYRQVGDHEFETTAATTSPWDTELQHGGPPSALLARAIEQDLPNPDLVVARFSVDFLGGIPQGIMTTTARVVRAGRRIELVEATLTAAQRPVAIARAWRLRPSPDAVPATPIALPAAIPTGSAAGYVYGPNPRWGYARSVEWRFVEGDFATPGRAAVWTRPRIPLIDTEASSGLQRMLVVADSINGLSSVLDMREWLYIATGLTLHAHRLDADVWLLLDAGTVLDPNGMAVAHGTISDVRGQLGLVSQPVLVQRR